MTMTDSKWYEGVEHFKVGQQLLDIQNWINNSLRTGMDIDLSRNELKHSLDFPKWMELKMLDHTRVRVGDGARPLIKAAVRSSNKDYKGDFPAQDVGSN